MRKDKIISEVLGEEATMTPSDLYNTEFKAVMFGGYDKDEVDRFLERVADVFESLITQVRDLKAKIEEHRQEMDSYRESEQTLRNALTSSQKFSETIVAAAKREAEAILEDARIARRRAEAESKQLPVDLAREIQRLQDSRDRLRDDLAAVLETHLRLLENIPATDFARVTVLEEDHDAFEEALVEEEEEGFSEAPAPASSPTLMAFEVVEEEEYEEEDEEDEEEISEPPIVPLEFEDVEDDEEEELEPLGNIDHADRTDPSDPSDQEEEHYR
jgi:cell division initiation protein